MPRYIDADKLSENMIERVNNPAIRSWLLSLINESPTADVAEVKRGEWIDESTVKEYYVDTYRCTLCGHTFVLDETPDELGYNYCPNCGAKMEGNDD